MDSPDAPFPITMSTLSHIFRLSPAGPRGRGCLVTDKDGTGRRALHTALLATCAAGGVFGFALPSCSPSGGLPAIRAAFYKDGARVEYSSAKGVMIAVDRRSGK